jgi:hypothetical protein
MLPGAASMINPSAAALSRRPFTRWWRALGVAGLCLAGLTVLRSAEVRRRLYVVPAEDAVVALHKFVEQSGVQVIYLGEQVRGVKTNPVNAHCTAREAVEHMFARTKLSVVEDRETGALMIQRKPAAAPKDSPRPSR